jgi:tetratricopeptide (TPR) repeat protein
MPYYNRGNAYRKLGKYQQAIRDYTEAINLNPYYTEAYRNRAGVNLEHGSEKLGCIDAQKACDMGLCDALSWAKNKGICR